METLTPRRALELLIDVVEAYGEDTVYERVPHHTGSRCVYVNEGKPSCLVGHVLVRAGCQVDVLQRFDDGVPAGVIHWHIPQVSGDAARVLDAAQTSQDIGYTWGEALEAAKARYRAIILEETQDE